MKDGVFKFRSDLDHTGFLQTDVSSQEFKQSNATICNGQLVYTITDGQIAKSQPDDAFYVYGGKPMLDFLGKDMDLRLGLDAVIDGQDVYTILGYPSGYSPDAKDIVTNAFAKDTGFVIHQESRDANGEITHLLHYTKIKKDAEFKADHFDFKPPPGTPVKDYTGGLPTAGP
jgi:outer membrane lipoprotein-sorting protein